MKIKYLTIAILCFLFTGILQAQILTNQESDENIYTIEQTRDMSFENQIKAYMSSQDGRLFVENQTSEAVTVQVVTIEGRLVFLKATTNTLVTISLKDFLQEGIYVLQVFDVHGNYYSKRFLVY
ncbi:MAG TPA: T9SS type A sorting domain-containing protein [Bacteroidales bacterium]|nr:T9SS type A sorting domain-containing protein [Bacteroidales bacterium]